MTAGIRVATFDCHGTLRRARERGLRLVIISNTDRDIIEHTLRHLRVPFDPW